MNERTSLDEEIERFERETGKPVEESLKGEEEAKSIGEILDGEIAAENRQRENGTDR